MARKTFQIGVMFSTTGSYSVVVRSMLNGALLAFQEIAATDGDIAIEPVVVNPAGDLQRYRALSLELLGSGIRQVVGCYTSSSRKEVIPCFEKFDGVLWYPSHYEGFESSDNVIYTGASPNQHVLPLVDYLAARRGKRAFCVGSNYIWAWENNRIFREALTARGGSVVAERYLPVGDTEFDQVVAAIVDQRPDFVFNNLIGTSAYAFFRAFRAACLARGIDQASDIPVASCTLSEPELAEIGPEAVDGHLSSSVYFSSLSSPASAAFVAAYARAFPDGPVASADAESSYNAVKLLAASLAQAGTDEARAVRAAVAGRSMLAPQGDVRIDPQTYHAWLTPRIARSTSSGTFEVLLEAREPLAPDPYLVQTSPRFAVAMRAPILRVVS
ncbi:transporter substrate-binding domain-containing protein [Bradyrhizobium sp. U87765 SZCCT0131]|uniref:transporter substrate-binding domain-containing protein n=1 Tax=unclassified Bradyrhizobium TaxID=2631580 RepID=UPI001BAC18F9|nr:MULTISPECIES: transporter substrate-binding domain-containing protein [unclassified Bradyrhizobium]MBR1219870.1 transporter substrate-binding domain-containing protein [Bradyrhizobium sp. U87765 SZCCT0131]MBR1262521.1 transporter substrate-binding domain-containing protein [Bradyrhizobium sp. U87765 SZCCT0134]MBR1308296.1 transporter substrate-binding domain-containing protein [Bradyrhizobium sp. U87765 SZCCT0110]MBR1318303.1 transporter substrate-binding domain-containing protein [Bradyrhiz